MLLQFLEVSIEIAKLIWQNIGVWHKIEVLLAISFLHSHHVEAQAIFTSDFVTLREVIDLLVLIQAFIDI